MLTVASKKEPWCGAFLSAVIPGLGQIYGGYKKRGIFFICTISLISAAFLAFLGRVILIPHLVVSTRTVVIGLLWISLGLAIEIFIVFDAYRSVKTYNDKNGFKLDAQRKKQPWLSAFLSYLIPGLGQVYNGQIIKGIIFCILIISVYPLRFVARKFLLVHVAIAVFLVHFFAVIFILLDAFNTGQKINNDKQSLFLQIPPIYGILIVCVLLIYQIPHGLFIKKNLVQAFKIPAKDMSPSIQTGDRILANKYVYEQRNPQRGEVVTFEPPKYDGESERGKLFLKRIVGLPGEEVEIKDGKVFINGEKLTEPEIFQQTYYHNRGDYGSEGKIVDIPQNHYYVLGDNSQNSKDSRYYGCIPRESIEGKAYKIYYPFDRSGAI